MVPPVEVLSVVAEPVPVPFEPVPVVSDVPVVPVVPEFVPMLPVSASAGATVTAKPSREANAADLKVTFVMLFSPYFCVHRYAQTGIHTIRPAPFSRGYKILLCRLF